MFGITLAALLLAFGIFLKTTDDPGFASTKKFSWLLIAIGAITLAGKLIIMYQKGEI
ncbi:hypothetical protein [Chryseobacterium sp.]|uniref:hypothetical protein n=1 Tax=Chryseobacterium sp. TaxID=1871047 RepID=UPI001656D757|nr:hypothetical protein [Chryseobacterium sp.]